MKDFRFHERSVRNLGNSFFSEDEEIIKACRMPILDKYDTEN